MKTRTTHERVIPRDLFNDAKILKCLGRLALVIHNGTDDKRPAPPTLEIEHDGQPFKIMQDPSDGSLSCANVKVMINGRPVHHWTTYNSREEYPLYLDFGTEAHQVFDHYGKFTDAFLCAVEAAPPAEMEHE